MAFTFLFLILLVGFFWLPGYVLSAVGLYSLAGRRGLDRPWMAWVPVLNLHLLGCISDQYQALVRGKNKNKRTWILLLAAVQAVAFGAMHLAAPAGEAAARVMPFLVIFVLTWVLCAAMVVIVFLALYDLYVSCDPKNAVLYLILSIVLSVTAPVFLFLCRNKDLGFPL